jgi:hypothetical protein
MRLPYLRKAAPGVLATARAQRWDPAEVLRVLLAEEVTGRDAATRRTRRTAAGFPAGKTFATWRPAESSIPAPTQDALGTLEWIGRAENLAVAGPSGTGKSHFVEALAHAAIEKDLRVAWFTLESLAAAVGRAKADGSVARTVTRICRCDLIVVDDIGMLPRRPGRRRGVLPHHRCRLRAPQPGSDQQHPPRRVRHDHAQDPGHRHRRPAAAPRPPRADRRRLPPPRPGTGRQGGGSLALTTPGRSAGHPPGIPVTASQEIS